MTILEIHGVANGERMDTTRAFSQAVEIVDCDDCIKVCLPSVPQSAGLTADQADMLGDQLKAAATRLRSREAPESSD